MGSGFRTAGIEERINLQREGGFGICRRRIPFADLSEVRPKSNPLSAPALSLDRLRVRFGRGAFRALMISPAARDLFLDELARKAGLKREGDRLFRV